MPDQNNDSPYRPLWKKTDDKGKPRLVGTIDIAGTEYWLTIYQNQRRTKDSHPTHWYRIDPKEPRP